MEQVALQSKMALSFYSQLERGEANPSLESLVRVANVLETSFMELLCAEELEAFEDLNRLLKGIPASMRTLTLKAFADVASLVRDTERTVKARYEKQ